MRYFYLPLLFFASEVLAQDSLYLSLVPRHAIKLSPFHLLSFYPTAQVAYEAKIARRFSFQTEAGYVLTYKSNGSPEYQNKRGAKAKLELHYYLLPRQRISFIYYGAAEIYLNAVNFDRSISEVECFDLQCNHTFTRQTTYKVMYREPGIGLKYGLIKYFNRLFVDLNLGLAIRFITYTNASIPPDLTDDVVAVWNFFHIPNENDRTTISPVVGIRLGYRLR